MSDQTRYLVAYDIADPRRLGRLCRYLKKRAFHLQYSVFLANLTQSGLKVLLMDIQGMIEPSEDDVRIYPMPRDPEWVWLGMAPLPEASLFMESGELLLPKGKPITLAMDVEVE